MVSWRVGTTLVVGLALAALMGCSSSGSASGGDAAAMNDGAPVDGTLPNDSAATDTGTAGQPESGNVAPDSGLIGDAEPGDAGESDGASPVIDAGPAPSDCIDRTKSGCQATSVGPRPAVDGGVAAPLTILGRDAYWIDLGPLATSPVTMHRSNLDTGATVTIAQPTDSEVLAAFVEPETLLNDGTNVYLTTLLCCSGSINPILEYAVGTGSWTSAEGALPQNLGGSVLAGGEIYTAYYGGFIDHRPLTNLASDSYWPTSNTTTVIGTDGTRVYFGSEPAFAKFNIRRFEGDAATTLTTVDGGPYGNAPLMPVDEAFVYFYQGTTVLRVSKSSPGAAQTVVDATPNHPSRAVVDPWSLYWIDEGGLHVVPKGGGTVVDLAPVSKPATLDQTMDYVVWTSASGLSKIRK